MIRVQRNLVLAALVFTAAAVVFGAALVRALTTEPTAPAAAPATADPPPAAPIQHEDAIAPATASKTPGATRALTPKPEVGPTISDEVDLKALMLAVDHDPFRPERQRPSERYRLPGEEIPEEPLPPQLPPPPPFRVLGTAMMPSGGVALVQVQETPPRVISVGEPLFGYTLASVGPGTATMEGQGRTLTLRVEDPPQNRARRGGRAAGPGRGAAPPAPPNVRQLQERSGQLLEAIEKLRGGGGNPQQIQQLMELLNREMEVMRRGVQGVEVQWSPQLSPKPPNQVNIRTRVDTMLMSPRN